MNKRKPTDIHELDPVQYAMEGLLDSFYVYQGKVTWVTDGDTIKVNIDLGFQTVLHQQVIRLAGINAPETRNETRDAGLAAKEYLKNLILNKYVVIQTFKDTKDKYGRYVAHIYLHNEETQTFDHVNQLMVKNGFANYQTY
jgi:micrococcal nuclease